MKKYIENIKSFFRKKKRYVEIDADTPPPENWKFTYRINNDGKMDIGEDGKPIVRKFVGYSDNESPTVIIWFLRNQYNLSYQFQGFLWYIECNNDITKLRHPFQHLFKITIDDPNADQSPIRAEVTYKTHLKRTKEELYKIRDEGYDVGYHDHCPRCPYPENSEEESWWVSGYNEGLNEYSRSFDMI